LQPAANVSAKSSIPATGGSAIRNLTERAIQRLRGAGFRPHWHQRVPPNDNGIELGQVAAVSYMKSNSKKEEAACASRFQERSYASAGRILCVPQRVSFGGIVKEIRLAPAGSPEFWFRFAHATDNLRTSTTLIYPKRFPPLALPAVSANQEREHL
jgi:hypothetical protein